jgi:FkbM family methyltransferase
MELDPKLVIERETDVGPIFLQKDATVFTPAVLEHGYWAKEITELMRMSLRPGMTFVDAGANIGYFTVLGSALVGPSGRVFTVEPDPLNLQILRANIAKNSCANVTVLPIAAWNERTTLNLFTPDEGGAGTHVERGEGAGDVEAAPLDEVIDGKVDYMKVDCEGSDHMVIMGAQRLFGENPRMFATVEFFADLASHTGHTPRQILEIYRDMGLRPFEIFEQRGLKPTTYEELAERGSSDPDEHVLFDFAICRKVPRNLVIRKGLLEKAGDILEHVPEPIRPKIRRRDRKPP